MLILREMLSAVKEFVLPQIGDIIRHSTSLRPTGDSIERSDDFSDDIEQAISAAKIQFKRKYTDREISFFAEKAADRMQTFNRKEFAKQFSAVLGIDLTTIEPWLPTEIKAFTRENVSLIKSIPDQYFDKVEQTIIRNVRAGALQPDIEKEIQRIYDVSESRAALIARDQTAKFNGTLTQLRQQSVGVKKYRWSTSLDERVRGNPSGLYPKATPSHFDRENLIYSWDSPPDGGHPGQDFSCRCQALPIFDDEEE